MLTLCNQAIINLSDGSGGQVYHADSVPNTDS